MLLSLIALGLLSLAFYYSWWRSPGRAITPWLAFLLALAAIYCLAQLLASWVLYFAARRRSDPPEPVNGQTIDIFVTACGEPLGLVERALTAACRMSGVHRTWLVDDGDDKELEALAGRLNAGYLTREGHKDLKAGNLNAALPRTSGDIVGIFDVDHVPEPGFLERTAGYFRDPDVGFVQVMLTFSNGKENWIAHAATESTYDYYNPTCMGADRIGGASLVGTNTLIRRKALESIGGYQPCLAEDLSTSITLHGAGWKSIYVTEPLAPGLSPPDLIAWFTQQFKWSRGVFELFLTAYPRLFFRLTWGQRLFYLVRMTYYWIGPLVAIHLLFMIAMLFGGSSIARINFQQYLIHVTPIALCRLLIRQVAIRYWRHPTTPAFFLWRPLMLVPATWPVYTLAWVMALCRIPLKFRPTPKTRSGKGLLLWLMPQIVTVLLLLSGMVFAVAFSEEHCPPLLLVFANLQLLPMAVLLYDACRGRSTGD